MYKPWKQLLRELPLTPQECRSAYASFYLKNQKYYGISPHRRRGLEARIRLAIYDRHERWIRKVICDCINFGLYE